MRILLFIWSPLRKTKISGMYFCRNLARIIVETTPNVKPLVTALPNNFDSEPSPAPKEGELEAACSAWANGKGLSATMAGRPHMNRCELIQVKRVNMASIYLGYRLARAGWAAVDLAPCNAFGE